MLQASEECSEDCSELFVRENGEPMQFSIRICYEKPELERKVMECGGQMVTGKAGPHTIRLFPKGERGFGKQGDFFSSQYIHDCVEQRTLLPLTSYRLNERSRYDGSIDPMDILMGKHSWDECKRTEEESDCEVSEFSDDNTGSGVELQKGKKSKNRAPYTHNERKAILNYIINNKRYAEVKGRLLWEDMSGAKVCPGRTWQSLKQHYRTFIIDNLSLFKLPDNVAKRIYAPYCSATQVQGGLYSEEELASENERETDKKSYEKNDGGKKSKTKETGQGSSKEQHAKPAGDKGRSVKHGNDEKILSESKEGESEGENLKTWETSQGSRMEQHVETADDRGQCEKDENEQIESRGGNSRSLEECAKTADDKGQGEKVDNEPKTVNEIREENPKTSEAGRDSSLEQYAKAPDNEQDESQPKIVNGNKQKESGGEKPKIRGTGPDNSKQQYAKTPENKDQLEKDDDELMTVNENKQKESDCQFTKESHRKENESLVHEEQGRQSGKGKGQVFGDDEDTRKEDSEVASNSQDRVELSVKDPCNRQEKCWTEQELEDLNSYQSSEEKQHPEEDVEKLQSKRELKRTRESNMEDCQTSQNDTVGKFQKSKEQTKESHASNAQRRETYKNGTEKFDCVLSTEEFRCTDLGREKPNAILMELEEDWSSASSAGDAMVSNERFSSVENSDKSHHTENEYSNGIRESPSPNHSAVIPKSPDMIQGDVYTPREFIMSKPQESVPEVNHVTERIDEDSSQNSSQRETKSQTNLESSEVTVEDINEMQKLIDGTFVTGNDDNVSPIICVNLPDTGSGIIENLKSQDSEAPPNCSSVQKNDCTSMNAFSSDPASSAVVHHKIPDPNLISSFLTNNDSDSLSEGSTVIFSVEEHMECSGEGKIDDGGNPLLAGKGEGCNEERSSHLNSRPKRKSLCSAPRMQKKTRLRPPRNSKASSQKTASETTDSVQPHKKTGKNSMQYGNFTSVHSSTFKKGNTRKRFVLISSGDESSTESDVLIQRSIPTVNRRRFTRQVVALKNRKIPHTVSEDTDLSRQEPLSSSRTNRNSSESEEDSETPSPDLFDQVSHTDPVSCRDNLTGRFDRSYYPHNGCTVGAARRSSHNGYKYLSVKKESYSFQEDMEILLFIARHQAYNRVGGRELWQEMQRCEILPRRSWHSMKERFRKRIIFHLHRYLQLGLSKEVMEQFQSHTPVKVEAPNAEGNERKWQPYTHEEDMLIIKYIAKNRRYSEVGGKTLWVLMSSGVPGLESRTWLSLKERFRKNIVNHLEDFGLSDDEVENFRNRNIKPVRRNGNRKNRISFRKPPIRNQKHDSKLTERLRYGKYQEKEASTENDDGVEMSDESDSDTERLRLVTYKKRMSSKGKRRLEADGKSEKLDEKKHEKRKNNKKTERSDRFCWDSDDSQVKPSTSGYIQLKKDGFGADIEKDDEMERSQKNHLKELQKANFKRKLFNQDEMAELSPRTPFNKGNFGSGLCHWKNTKRKEISSSLIEEEQRRKKSRKETSCKSNEEENASTSEEGNNRDKRITGIPLQDLDVAKEEQNSQTECNESKENRSVSINQETHEVDSEGDGEQEESVSKNVDKNVDSVVDSCESKKTIASGPPSPKSKILTSQNENDESTTQADVTPGPDLQERSLSYLTNVKAKSLKSVILDGSKSSSGSLVDVVNVLETDKKHETISDLVSETSEEVKLNLRSRHVSAQDEVSPERIITKHYSESARYITRNKIRKKIIHQMK